MEALGLILALAVLVEGLIEHYGVAVPSSFKPYVSGLLGIAACLTYNADVLSLLGYSAVFPYVGQVLTGLIIGRGANYVNDIWAKFTGQPKPEDAGEPNTNDEGSY